MANQANIKYQLGNRLEWPKTHSDLTLKIVMAKSLQNKQEAEEIILKLFEQAVKEKSDDATVWESFFNYFFSPKKKNPKDSYEKALYALQRYKYTASKSNPEELKKYDHCPDAWQGMVLDLLGRRDEAVSCYKKVLQNFKEKCDYCSQVDRKWLEDRLKTPFKWE